MRPATFFAAFRTENRGLALITAAALLVLLCASVYYYRGTINFIEYNENYRSKIQVVKKERVQNNGIATNNIYEVPALRRFPFVTTDLNVKPIESSKNPAIFNLATASILFVAFVIMVFIIRSPNISVFTRATVGPRNDGLEKLTTSTRRKMKRIPQRKKVHYRDPETGYESDMTDEESRSFLIALGVVNSDGSTTELFTELISKVEGIDAPSSQ